MQALIAEVLGELEATGVLPAAAESADRAASSSRRDSPWRLAGHVERRGRGRRRRRVVLDAPALAPDRQHAPWTMARARRRSTSASSRCASASTSWREQRRVLAEEYRLLRVAAGSRAGRGRPAMTDVRRPRAVAGRRLRCRFAPSASEGFWGTGQASYAWSDLNRLPKRTERR